MSGKLDPTIFADDCKFKDPTVSDQGTLCLACCADCQGLLLQKCVVRNCGC